MSETAQNSISALLEVESRSIKSIEATTAAIQKLSHEAKVLKRVLDSLPATDHKTRRQTTANLNSVQSRLDMLGAGLKGPDQRDLQALIQLGVKQNGRILRKDQPLGTFSARDQQLILKATQALTNPDFLATLTKQVKSRKVGALEGETREAYLTPTQRRQIASRAAKEQQSLANQQALMKEHETALKLDRAELNRVAKARKRQAEIIDKENAANARNIRKGGRYKSAAERAERDLIARGLRNRGDFTGGQDITKQDTATQKRWRKVQERLADPAYQSTLKGSLARPENIQALNDGLKQVTATFAENVKVQKAAQAAALAAERRAATEAAQQGVKPKAAPVNALRAPPTVQEMGARSREASRERMFGDGGAQLFRTQGALMGNYALMGGGISGMMAVLNFTVQLDKSFKQLQSIVRLTDTEMRGLEKTLISVSEKTKFTAVEVAEAATVLGQAGFNKDQIEKAIEPITLFATAVGTDLAQAVDLATSVMGIFDMEAGQLTDVANIMTTAINDSKLTMDKLSLGIQYSGNLAAQAGIDFKELVSLLGAMANSGIRSGSMLGTGFRQVLISLQAPSAKFKKRLAELNITLSDLDVRTHGMVNVLKTLTEAGFTSADAMEVLETRSAAAFSAMVNNLDVADALGRSMGVTASAAEANEIQMTSLANQWDRLRSIALSIGADTFGPLKDTFTSLIKMSADLLSNLKQYAPAMNALTVIGSGLGAYGLAKALGWVGGLLKSLIASGGFGMGLSAAAGMIGAGARGGVVGPMGPMRPMSMGARAGLVGRGLMGFGPIGLAAGTAIAVGASMYGEPAISDTERYRTEANAASGRFESSKTNIERVDKALNTIYDRSGLGELGLATEINKIADSFRDLNFTLSTVGGTTEQAIKDFKNLKTQLLLEAKVANDGQIRNLQDLGTAQEKDINSTAKGVGERLGVGNQRVFERGTSNFTVKSLDVIDQARLLQGGLKGSSPEDLRGYRDSILRTQDTIQKQLTELEGTPGRRSEISTLKSVLGDVQVLFDKLNSRIDTANQIEVQKTNQANLTGTTNLNTMFDKAISDLQQRFVIATNDPFYRKKDFQIEQSRRAKEESAGFEKEAKAIIAAMKAEADAKGYTDSAVNSSLSPLLSFMSSNKKFLATQNEEAKPQLLDKLEGELRVANKLKTELETKQSNTIDQKKVREYQAKLDEVAAEIERIVFDKATLNLVKDEGYSEAYSNALMASEDALASRKSANKEAADNYINRLEANSLVDGVFKGADVEAAIRRVGDSEFKKAFEKKVLAETTRADNARLEVLKPQDAIQNQLQATNYGLSRAQNMAGDGGLMTQQRKVQNQISVSLLADQNALQLQLLDLEKKALEAQKIILAETLKSTERVLADSNADGETRRSAEVENQKLKKQIEELNAKLGDVDNKKSKQGIDYNEANDKLADQGYFIPKARSLYMDETRRRTSAQLYGTEFKSDAGNDYNFANEKKGIFDQVVDQTNAQYEGFDIMAESVVNLQQVVNGLGDSLGNVFAGILDGTQKGSKAFKAMGHAIFSDMTQLASKMLANQLLASLFRSIGGAMTSMGGPLAQAAGAGSCAAPAPAKWNGGEVYGGAYAGGGEITTGMKTRDSTYIKAAKGEFVVRSEAVDAIGVDTLKTINNLNKNTVKNSAALQSSATEARPLFAPQLTTSVYLLDKTTPPPSMGANEVLAVITDDMVRKGQTRTLIKQIQTGQL